MIYLKPRYKGLVEGLCGNYNDLNQDEFQHNSMIFNDPIQFGNSWITADESCSPSLTNETAPLDAESLCLLVSDIVKMC
jgi:hypothetical protein